jgi:DNA end-binding protein Ku
MAPRAYRKGYLRLPLVTCPVALYPATSDADNVSFNQSNKKTGHRNKYVKVDADTGEDVPNEDITKGSKSMRTPQSRNELENVPVNASTAPA